MQEALIQFVGAVLITYFLSRAFRRVVRAGPQMVKLTGPHLLSLGVIVLVLFLLRYPMYVFHKEQVVIYFVGQFIWVVYDVYRSGAVFWRPPVAQPTESSARSPGAGSR